MAHRPSLDQPDPMWAANCRRAMLCPPTPPEYRPILELEIRRLRLFEMWRAAEAANLLRDAGLEVPKPQWRRRHDQNYG